MAEDIIGKRFESHSGGWFTVIRKTEKKQSTAYLYEIEFDEYNGVKYKSYYTKGHINMGRGRNPYYPTVYGIGYVGNVIASDHKYIYTRWSAMLRRCYCDTSKKHKNYRAEGITVCDRWHSFENFLNDFPLIEGYDEANLSKLDLDKDVKFFNNKIYSLENCMLVLKDVNIRERWDRWKKSKTIENVNCEL
ncbi:hypothetical protein CN692_14205 [Bacillus sp. AFS002410]|uniref:hypothetical protein n=1 Tax=Bacillus sp. AFS002410 TaxID=2033481 RepID=UPI000BEFC923|nr:hypothetical protein [Bacillus sp. AFS002410]PEJ57047.1 hypothetical protein CN692_14205 [Bacillus sp. AFS002410]